MVVVREHSCSDPYRLIQIEGHSRKVSDRVWWFLLEETAMDLDLDNFLTIVYCIVDGVTCIRPSLLPPNPTVVVRGRP